jgi:hypothetical protein
MEPPIRPLMARLHDIPAPRYPRGRRLPLAAILALMGVALPCGYRSASAIADGGRCDGQKLARALGVIQAKTPCAATLSHVMRQLDGTLVADTLGAWAASVLTALPPAPDEVKVLAIDGKTRRGRRQPGAPAVHLFSALH